MDKKIIKKNWDEFENGEIGLDDFVSYYSNELIEYCELVTILPMSDLYELAETLDMPPMEFAKKIVNGYKFGVYYPGKQGKFDDSQEYVAFDTERDIFISISSKDLESFYEVVILNNLDEEYIEKWVKKNI